MLDSKIINYSDLIRHTTADFTGRQWVCHAIDDFLQVDSPRNFLLLGEPGCGKTAFMANLVRERGYPHHFIGKGSFTGLESSADWRNPIRFAESLGYQLLRDYGGWVMDWESWGITVEQHVQNLEGLLVGAEVGTFDATPGQWERPLLTINQEIEHFGEAAQQIGVYIDKWVARPEQIVYQLVTVPLRRIANRYPEEEIVILVDGLDEASDYSDLNANILRLLPGNQTPRNVRLILSSRPGEHLTNDFLSRCKVFWLSEDEDGNIKPDAIRDAEDYVMRFLQETQMQQMLRKHGITATTLSTEVAKASNGNFLYLYYFAAGLRAGNDRLMELSMLPRGLNGIYADFLTKYFKQTSDTLWVEAYKPVLGVLAVAQAELTCQQLSDFSQVDPSYVATVLMQLDQLLHVSGDGKNTKYSVYNKSFSEYLLCDENRHAIDGEKMHRQIADHYWNLLHSSLTKVDNYGLNYLAFHLAKSGQVGRLRTLVKSRQWAFARSAGFLADIVLAWPDLDERIDFFRGQVRSDPEWGDMEYLLIHLLQLGALQDRDSGRIDASLAKGDEVIQLLRRQAELNSDRWNPQMVIRLGYTAKTNAQNQLSKPEPDVAKAAQYLKQAEACFQDVLVHFQAVDPSSSSAKYYCSGAHNGLANVLQMRGMYDQALDHYKIATDINPQNTFSFWDYSWLLQGLVKKFGHGWCQDAVQITEQAVEIVSESPDFTAEHVDMLKKSLGRLKETCEESTEWTPKVIVTSR